MINCIIVNIPVLLSLEVQRTSFIFILIDFMTVILNDGTN